jgi:endonuclease YncB( thermonuclease family)
MLLLLGLAAPLAAQGSASNWFGTVTHVSDGDTLWVRPQRGGPPRAVRLDGIDAPELCQVHGETARAALVGRVLGQAVQVRVRRHDDYGRALARISLRGHDVGAWLVSQGHAWSYRYRGKSGPYAQQEGQARTRRLGLFRLGRAELPRDFRRRQGPCH